MADKLWDDLELAEAWAAETRDRLSPESPIAILRLREIRSAAGALVVRYGFRVVPAVAAASELAAPAFAMRSDVDGLLFREAPYGGKAMPSTSSAFELAPPQIAGVQPLYQIAEGWSGVRLGVVYGKDELGVVPAETAKTLWWQAPEHAVQFRAAGAGGSPSAGLPGAFRARAISSLRPATGRPPMPAEAELAATLEPDGEAAWKPVLPGSLHCTLIGNRSGAMLSLRHHLIRQSRPGGEVLVSGSVPVQHRVPRPVPLLEDSRAVATVDANPFADVLFAGPPEARLTLTLADPRSAHGLIDPSWDGSLTFAAVSVPAATTWKLAGSIAVGGVALELAEQPSAAASTSLRLSVAAANKPALARVLGSQPAGAVVTFSVRANPAAATGGLVQTMSFPLRMKTPNAGPLPLQPFFVNFEDPAYNRQLASATASESALIKVGEQVPLARLAADRKDYNADSVIAIRWNWLEAPPANAPAVTLKLTRKDKSGIPEPIPVGTTAPAAKLLVMVPLAASGFPLSPGDVVQVELEFQTNPVQRIRLDLNIVARSVLPAAPSAFALLRANAARSQVECVRFAWSPQAARIELVSAEDLDTDVVRRRAVFQWSDTSRTGSFAKGDYRVQKIAAGGATHQTF